MPSSPTCSVLRVVCPQLNEIYNVPNMLATILYAGLFIAFANSAGNAFAFAKFVLIAATHLGDGPVANASNAEAQLNPALVRFIAISILTVVCFLHYTWSRLGLFLNKALALYKIVLCLVVFGAGVAAWNKPDSGVKPPENFGQIHSGGFNSLSALVIIFYSYEGWENATYVRLKSFHSYLCIKAHTNRPGCWRDSRFAKDPRKEERQRNIALGGDACGRPSNDPLRTCGNWLREYINLIPSWLDLALTYH